jgi:hypothetical protein
MFLHEDSEQMKDKRIQTISYYEDTEGRVEKKFKKRINNTLPLKAPPHSSGIFNLGTKLFMKSIQRSLESC